MCWFYNSFENLEHFINIFILMEVGVVFQHTCRFFISRIALTKKGCLLKEEVLIFAQWKYSK